MIETENGNVRKGILFIVLSALSFAAMSALVRLADDFGGPIGAIQKSFFRNVVAAGIAAVMFWRRGCGVRRPGMDGTAAVARGRMPRGAGEWTALVARAVCGTIGIFGNFWALSHIPVGDAYALNKTSPFFALVFTWMLLGERVSLRQGLCVLGAFAGALCVVKPGFAGAATWPAFAGLLSGMGAGAAYAFLHKLGRAGVNGAFIVLFFSIFSCVLSVPFFAAHPDPMTTAQVLVLLGAGAAAACGQFAITAAYRHAEPRQIAVFDYTGILFASLFGFVLFGQLPDAVSWLGFAMIAGMAFALHPRRR